MDAQHVCCCWTSVGTSTTTIPRTNHCAPLSPCSHWDPAAKCHWRHRGGPGPSPETCSPPGQRTRSKGRGLDTAWSPTLCSEAAAAEAKESSRASLCAQREDSPVESHGWPFCAYTERHIWNTANCIEMCHFSKLPRHTHGIFPIRRDYGLKLMIT